MTRSWFGKRGRKAIGTTVLTMLLGSGVAAPALAGDDGEAAFRSLYRELVEIDTTLSAGDCTAASRAMAARLAAAGYPQADLQILGPAERPREHALIATLHGSAGSTLAPLLLLAHVDVVEARRADWQRDPFKLVEEDGWFYARGASDDKAMAAIFTDAMIRYRREGYRPRRDIKLALTCGEETSEQFNSVSWLLAHQPDALKAAFALNEGAGGELDASGRPVSLQIQAGEKVYADFTLEITNNGGHSSRPVADNAIYRLAAALQRLAAYTFPIALNDATRGYFQAQAALVGGGRAADQRGTAVGYQPRLEQHAAHHLRGDAAGRRPCTQCAAAARHGQRQLPDFAGRAGRSSAAGLAAHRRRRRHRDPSQRRPGHRSRTAADAGDSGAGA